MKIIFFEIRGPEKSYLKKALKGHTVDFCKEPLTTDNVKLAKGYDVVSVFIYSKIDKRVLDALPKLKMIATRSTGFDHINIKYCEKKKITVCNVPFYGENTVAEHTFALILALSRNIHKSYVRTQRNDYTIEGLKGFDLKGRTLGVIGAGRIGLHVIKTARGFGMNVIAFDVHRNDFMSEVMHFDYKSMKEVLKKSDIISLHAPCNEQTKHMINSKTISMMKKGAILINTSRGELVDTDALISALRSGHLGGAGLDVIEGEELIKEEKQLLYDTKTYETLHTLTMDHVLLHMDNVVFTPHIGFYSDEAIHRILDTSVENIKHYFGKGLSSAYKVC